MSGTALQREEVYRRTLEAILKNATSYHAMEDGKQRALTVIGSWASDALHGRLHESVEKIVPRCKCDHNAEPFCDDCVAVMNEDARS